MTLGQFCFKKKLGIATPASDMLAMTEKKKILEKITYYVSIVYLFCSKDKFLQHNHDGHGCNQFEPLGK